MTGPRLYLVDVFAERPLAGNPLAVVVGAEALESGTMQRLAAEINFSETAFLPSLPDDGGAWPLRLFTPAREIAFAGHPLLGAAWVIRRFIDRSAAPLVRLKGSAGEIPVSFEHASDSVWFRAPAITLGPVCPPERMAHALGLSPDDLDDAPVQRAAAQTAAMVVPLRSMDALRRSRPDPGQLAALARDGFPPLLYLFCRMPEDPANHLSVRFFFDAHGVREDPATGNGAAFLGAWLLAHGRVEPGILLRIEQGHGLGRPSLVLLHVEASDAIRVGGRVRPVARGELYTQAD